MGDFVNAIVLRGGLWTVAAVRTVDLKDRFTLGTCAVYDDAGKAILDSIAKTQNLMQVLRG